MSLSYISSRAVASLTVPDGQEFHFPHFSSNFNHFFLKLYLFYSSFWLSGWASCPPGKALTTPLISSLSKRTTNKQTCNLFEQGGKWGHVYKPRCHIGPLSKVLDTYYLWYCTLYVFTKVTLYSVELNWRGTPRNGDSQNLYTGPKF